MSTCTRILGPETNCDDPVARMFMGQKNIAYLNNAIRQGVFELSDSRFKIAQQSQNELFTIMRSIYLNEARHLPYSVEDQVTELNKSVLTYAVPQIISEVQAHQFYLRDRLQEQRTPNPQAVMTSTAGRRTEVAAPARAWYAPEADTRTTLGSISQDVDTYETVAGWPRQKFGRNEVAQQWFEDSQKERAP